MSSRSVELQVAIPRTSEIGNAQNHLMQKPVYDQTALAAKMMQQKERQLKQSTKIDEPAGPLVGDERQAGKGDKGKKERNPGKTRTETANANAGSVRSGHPYKGHHIDFSL
ncbi:hypothetical protein FE783_03695 [Paenibacillus mesophilus]|uniref:hypothetical protein n=1 Tax=Paenibacillus mesophilus TaxID=2582849 RepID=UPI00110DC853|nr:hypothetical protein [Paenibacillus mesophilus]TMV52059.1 hypothetical protein FE783_03695 [Paenibacillus mesophilus]